MFWSAGCSLLRAEGFTCSLEIPHGGPGINKWEFSINKRIYFSAVIKALNPNWIRIRLDLTLWIRNRNQCGSPIVVLASLWSMITRCTFVDVNETESLCIWYCPGIIENFPVLSSCNHMVVPMMSTSRIRIRIKVKSWIWIRIDTSRFKWYRSASLHGGNW